MVNFKEIFLTNPIVCVTIEEKFSNILRKYLDTQKYVKYTAWAQIKK